MVSYVIDGGQAGYFRLKVLAGSTAALVDGGAGRRRRCSTAPLIRASGRLAAHVPGLGREPA